MKNQDQKYNIILAGKKLVDSGLISRTWGNISCRIDEKTMLITPSGKDYHLINPDEIVEVNLSDCSYEGAIKPSVEKGIHAAIYNLKPEVNFIIHTHQNNASVVGVLGEDVINLASSYPMLGKEILCAKYGLPGSKQLCRNVTESIKKSSSHAVIMVNHGAVCFGKDEVDAFTIASQLEVACEEFLIQKYKKISGQSTYSAEEMRTFALSQKFGKQNLVVEKSKFHRNSVRTNDGFMLFDDTGLSETISLTDSKEKLGNEEKITHQAIYKKFSNVNFIRFSEGANTVSVAKYPINLRPLLDDFAQIAGTIVRSAENQNQILRALTKSSSVFIKNEGALCIGITKDDADAVAMILEKTCQAFIGASLFNNIKPINKIECILMRWVYLTKYSKEKYKKKA